jgi:hypothetical protein
MRRTSSSGKVSGPAARSKRLCASLVSAVEGLDKFLGVGQDRDEVGLGNWCREPAGFSIWPSKRRAG